MIPREYLNMTPVTFVGKFGMDPPREGLTMLVEKSDDESDQLFVFFPDEEKVGVKPIRILVERMKAEGVVSAIMVLRQGVTSLAKQAVLEVSDSFSIEHFREAELLVDITEHTLVPEHIVLTTSEKNELLKRYRLRETQLPRIQLADPVVSWIHFVHFQKFILPANFISWNPCKIHGISGSFLWNEEGTCS